MTSLAQRYAQALWQTGQDEGQLICAVQAVTAPSELWQALLSPVVTQAEKKALFASLPSCTATPELLRFFHLLVETGRLSLLEDIAAEYHILMLTTKSKAECIMTCARIPSQAQQTRLSEAICKLHGKAEVILQIRVDPELIGGFLLEIEGVTYDQSVRGRLQGLSRYLEEVSAI